jgi:hypothetical protein
MKENNVINLSDYVKTKKEIETFNIKEFEYFDIKNDQITLRRISAFAADFFVILMVFNMIQVSYAAFVQNILIPLNYIQKSNLINGTTAINVMIFCICLYHLLFYE